MYKWKSRPKGPHPRTEARRRLEAWAVGVTFLVLITVTVAQSLAFGR